MTIIASVLVDVNTRHLKKPFDYLIPEEWTGKILPGMRVIVPFGPRKLQGFVLEIKSEADVSKLKNIIEPVDLIPVLTDELLHLGNWLSDQTLSLKNTVYQAMLPSAMKAKYKKVLRLIGDNHEGLPVQFFNKNKELSWEDAKKQGVLNLLQQAVKQGKIEVQYQVQQKSTLKKRKMLHCLLSDTELTSYLETLPKNAYKKKQVMERFYKQEKSQWQHSLKEEVDFTSATIRALEKDAVLTSEEKEVYRDPYKHRTFKPSAPFPLTEVQQEAIAPILDCIETKQHETFLLHGVTGSGKTEIYLQSIQKVLESGKEAIMLVPEISLTPQIVQRFKSRFGDKVAVLHSGLSFGEKYDEWRKIQRHEAQVVVGARSAIFAPFENIGMIIIDEEHEASYKQEEHPRYHARDVAIKRAAFHQCPVVLGSATPALESYARAKKGVYTLLTMNKRMNNQALPDVSIVDMREELRNGNRSMFSVELFEKLQDRIEKKEQTVLFLNKRGHSSFIMCRDCGFVQQCPDCDISLTYHRHAQLMKCHYCNYETTVPHLCPECESEHIRYFGTGTQKVQEELNKLLPEARVIRMDVDTTSKKGAHEKLLKQFEEHEADILLGTQMIAKGLDFPNITLVGVLSADTMLHLPDFRASEKTFQLLTQVSGRAGRHDLTGEVVIQTYSPEHYSIEMAKTQNYENFYMKEMGMRKIGSYTPFYFLTLVTVSHEDVLKSFAAAEKISNILRAKLSGSAVILGPVTSPIPRIKNRYRYQCLIKYKREPALLSVLQQILSHFDTQMTKEGLTIIVDNNPYMMM